MRFLKSKIGFTATYWDGTENQIPYAVSIAQYSGFTSKYLNTGKIVKQGIDLSLNLRPVNQPNFSWEVNASLAYLIKENVVKIADGVDKFVVQVQWANADGSARNNTPAMIQAAGRPWGEIYGAGMARDSATGKPLLTSAGLYVSDPNHYFGNVLPKVTGGLQNSFRIFKDFIVGANIDYQFGGKFFSLSNMWGAYSGLTAGTSGLNDKGIPIRDPVADGGGVHVFGVDQTTRKDVDYYVACNTYWQSMYDVEYFDAFVYDLTYIKLRELSIGYDIPVNKLGIGKYIQGITVAFVAQNPWLIYAKTKDFDPSEISRAGGETGQFPGIRSFGTNIKIKF
jgi:outer membrane receptor protein involved in Fe transport